MSTLTIEIEVPYAQDIIVTSELLNIDLSDGRSISVPLAWFPMLVYANQKERDNWRIIGRGEGIHWEDIDEDISVEGLLAGKASGESNLSLKKWMSKRSAQQNASADPGLLSAFRKNLASTTCSAICPGRLSSRISSPAGRTRLQGESPCRVKSSTGFQ